MFDGGTRIPIEPIDRFVGGWCGIGRRRVYRLTEPVRFTFAHGNAIEVPKDTLTDLATVPCFLWWIFPPAGPWARSAILHDRLCDLGYDRELTDAIFRYAMKRDGVGFLTRQTIYAGVRGYAITYNTIKRAIDWIRKR